MPQTATHPRIQAALDVLDDLDNHTSRLRGRPEATAAHLRGDRHDWTVRDTDLAGELDAMHELAHAGDYERARAGLHDAEEEACGGVPRAPGHTCHAGPLCAYWSMDGDGSNLAVPGGCIHGSCMQIMHEECVPCEAGAAGAALDLWERQQPLLRQQRCPFDGSPLAYRAEYAAPGYGQAWECRAHAHPWVKIGPHFTDARDGVPELTLGDVI